MRGRDKDDQKRYKIVIIWHGVKVFNNGVEKERA